MPSRTGPVSTASALLAILDAALSEEASGWAAGEAGERRRAAGVAAAAGYLLGRLMGSNTYVYPRER